MINFVLVIIVILCSTLLGNWFSTRLEARRQSLSTIIVAITKMKSLISFGGFEISRVVNESFESAQGFECFCRELTDDVGFTDFFNSCVDEINIVCALSKEDKALLKRFGEGLGVSDTEGQISNCELYRELLSEKLAEAKDAVDKKSKLYRVLGFSMGCAVALMVL
ncbi:MAG: stage III sporulation protein AB [Clostridia bacterium]|nr:stage III sporulation protein AB [Clostridia bacterium]